MLAKKQTAGQIADWRPKAETASKLAETAGQIAETDGQIAEIAGQIP